MTSEDNDAILRGLRRLSVLEPEPARSERVRQRCRIVLTERHVQAERSIPSRPFGAILLESGLIYGLSVAYLFAMIGDLVRAYLRR